MTTDVIQKFIETDDRKNKRVRIHFKARNTITGIFIFGSDYKDMKVKNFWRIVPQASIDKWENSNDPSLSRIYNGSEFTKLTDDK